MLSSDDEPAVGDERRQPPAAPRRGCWTSSPGSGGPGVGDGHPTGDVDDVDAAERLQEPHPLAGDVVLRCSSSKPPTARGALRHELHGEHLAEGGVVLTPAEADQLHEQPGLVLGLLRRGPREAPLQIGAVEDQAAHPFGVPGGVGDGDGPPWEMPSRGTARCRRRRRPSRDRSPTLRGRSRRRPSRTARSPARRSGPGGGGPTAHATSAATPGSPSRSRGG